MATAALHRACLHTDDPDEVRQLLDRGDDIHAIDERGQSPLYIACQMNHVRAATLLLDRGADVEQGRTGGASPLILACMRGRFDVVTLCLDNGADVDRASQGYSPLNFASLYGHSSIVSLLLDRGADIRDSQSEPSLWAACTRGTSTLCGCSSRVVPTLIS